MKPPSVTNGDFARRLGFAVLVTGIKTTGVVRCDQPRVLDFGARNARKVDPLPATIKGSAGEARPYFRVNTHEEVMHATQDRID